MPRWTTIEWNKDDLEVSERWRLPASGVDLLRRLPVSRIARIPGQEFVEAVDRVLADADEEIAQISFRPMPLSLAVRMMV
jgi:histone H3/H4